MCADFNQAVGLTDDPQNAINKGIDQQTAASNRALNLSEQQYAYEKKLQEPFYNGGLQSFGTLAATINGKPFQYNDPNYTELTQSDLDGLSNEWIKKQGLPDPRQHDYRTTPELLAGNPYGNKGAKFYRGPNGEITDKPPQVTAQAFNPAETPAFKWQAQQQDQLLGRNLRSLGRQNSTQGMNAMGVAKNNLIASEYDKQLGRLADMTNIARGGASTLAGASSNFSTQAGNNLQAAGANAANASLAGGMLSQQQGQNSTQNLYGLANLGMKLYQQNKNGGGNGGGGEYNFDQAQPDNGNTSFQGYDW